MSEHKKKVCEVLVGDDVEKQTQCESTIDEFASGNRDNDAFNRALEKLSVISGLSKPDVVKKINDMDLPEPVVEVAVEEQKAEVEEESQG